MNDSFRRGRLAQMGECPPINQDDQGQFPAEEFFFRALTKKCATSTFQITLANGMPSTGTMRKRILHSLSE